MGDYRDDIDMDNPAVMRDGTSTFSSHGIYLNVAYLNVAGVCIHHLFMQGLAKGFRERNFSLYMNEDIIAHTYE